MKIRSLLIQSFGVMTLSAFTLFGAVSTVAAAGFDNSSKLPINGNSSFSSQGSGIGTPTEFIASFGTNILNIVLLIIAILAVFFLLLYGFQYITAGGDPEKAKKARSGIINAVIGIAIVASAFYIVDFALQGSTFFKGLTTAGGSNNSNSSGNGGGVGVNPN